MCENSMDFRQGDRFPDLVFLGACPGQREFNNAPPRPFVGKSGSNLRVLIKVLREIQDKEAYGLRPDDFASDRVDDYTLMNSHDEAKWKGQHRRTTPLMSEVDSPENRRRIVNQLQSVNARVVIGLGRPVDDEELTLKGNDTGPLRVIRNLAADHQGILFVITGHPSPQAINRHGGGDARQWFLGKLRRFPLQ